MNTGRVTIAITCFNQAQYLSDAIESALGQSHPAAEIIVVDDGSTDGTAQVAANYPRVLYLHQENRGLAAARNRALAAATGDFIVFLDADDRLRPPAIEAGLDCFRRERAPAFVYGAYINIWEDGLPAPTRKPRTVLRDHYRHLLEGNFIGMHATILYRRDLAAAEGGFDESRRACEDYDLLLRLTRRYPAAGHDSIVAEYRQHGSNMSKDAAMMLRNVLAVLDAQRPFLTARSQLGSLAAGRRIWKDYYGALLLEQWRMSRDKRLLLTLLRNDPRGFVDRAARAVWARTRRRRLIPASTQFGFDRGLPIDRYYIEAFLEAHAQFIRGRVLEAGDDAYSRRFGAGSVTKQDVLHHIAGAPGATIVADLSNSAGLPAGAYDCIVLTQTLHYIYGLDAAVANLHRMLSPGGTLLATLPGISRLCTDQPDERADCWRFTPSSAAQLFGKHFGAGAVRVSSAGNVRSAAAFLQGLAARELHPIELDSRDSNYPVTITVHAVKAPHATLPVPSELHRLALSPDRPRDLGSLVAVRNA